MGSNFRIEDYAPISEEINRAPHDIDDIFNMIEPPGVTHDIIVYNYAGIPVGYGPFDLLGRFLEMIEQYPDGFTSNRIMTISMSNDPDIAAWLLVCVHLARLDKYSVRQHQTLGWNIADPQRPCNYTIVCAIISGIHGNMPVIPLNYALIYRYDNNFIIDFRHNAVYNRDSITRELLKHPRATASNPRRLEAIHNTKFELFIGTTRIKRIVIPIIQW